MKGMKIMIILSYSHSKSKQGKADFEHKNKLSLDSYRSAPSML